MIKQVAMVLQQLFTGIRYQIEDFIEDFPCGIGVHDWERRCSGLYGNYGEWKECRRCKKVK